MPRKELMFVILHFLEPTPGGLQLSFQSACIFNQLNNLLNLTATRFKAWMPGELTGRFRKIPRH